MPSPRVALTGTPLIGCSQLSGSKSILLNTGTTIPLAGQGGTSAVASITHSIKSASLICRLARSIPADSNSSLPSRNPAVSDSSNNQPSNARVTVTTSRVVPGVGETTLR